MTRINTYEDLLAEKQRLTELFAAQKELVRRDVEEVKLELAPVRKAIGIVGKVVTKDNSNFLLTTAADMLIDMLLKKMVLAKAGWITRLAIPFFTKNFSSHVIADNKDKILSTIFSWFSKSPENGQAVKKEVAEEEEED